MLSNQEKICGISTDAPRCRNISAPQVTVECQKMVADQALSKITECASSDAPDRISCLEARDTFSACIESKS